MRPRLAWVPAAIARHRGPQPEHLDVFLAAGALCLSLRLAHGRWQEQAPHRRRYLSYSGPLSAGRGAVAICWRGLGRLRRTSGGWQLELRRGCATARWLLADGGIVRALGGRCSRDARR
ncbi:MAG: hypothetical protein RMM29_02330 [Planctomycetota bacterium]|nr:hypothetical protein [Planctomycetota bacterium]MCX8040230.1 hypothetical protein [Planctomycetota bacterium]MDW8372475.1 hypothetical protein [Planctomycetota bacterium]